MAAFFLRAFCDRPCTMTDAAQIAVAGLGVLLYFLSYRLPKALLSGKTTWE
ncbi:MAG: hypothetical protein ACREVE_13560 [Gammaproteobacteria bacterium]